MRGFVRSVARSVATRLRLLGHPPPMRSSSAAQPPRVSAAAASGRAPPPPPPPHTNRLASSNSPYLLEHAHNPVDWREWGEDAFAAAKAANKPILLSSGYSACRWCHNMARECFEDETVAAAMNDGFICIKLDRETRPDIDAAYMSYLTATTGSGGWPMTVFLTPSTGAPFFAGTYFPRPAFLDLLGKVGVLWETRRGDVEAQASASLAALREAEAEEGAASTAGPPVDGRAALAACAAALSGRFDPVHGAFGGAPKFPRPAELAALHAHRLLVGPGDGAAVEAQAATTLLAWTSQGAWDALGGALARYSVDALLHVPHFEKMAYDQGQLIRACVAAAGLAAVRAAGGPPPPPSTSSTNPVLCPPPAVASARLAAAAAATASYLVREMTDADGGAFYSAQDAESVDLDDGVKKEGWWSTWSEAEVDAVLAAPLDEAAASSFRVPPADLAAAAATIPHTSPTPPALVAAFKAHYGVRPGGNCDRDPRSDPHCEFVGRNVFYQARSLEATAAALGEEASVDAAASSLAACRLRLFVARSSRPPPATDDKVVAAWNGLTIGALAVAGRALAGLGALGGAPPACGWPASSSTTADPHTLVSAAAAAATTIKARLWNPATKRLVRYYRGDADALATSPPAVADDYAHLACASLDLGAATGDTQWVAWAVDLQDALDTDFWDGQGGGYWTTDGKDPTLTLRKKELYDGAEPAAGSVAAENALRLAALAAPGSPRAAAWEARGRAALTAMLGGGRPALAAPQAAASAFLAVAWPPRQVVVVGPRGLPSMDALLDAAFAAPAPDKVIIPLFTGDEACLAFWRAFNPEAVAVGLGPGTPAPGQATAFVCADFTCRAPTSDPAVLAAALEAPRRGGGGGGGGGGPAPVSPIDLGALLGKK